MTALPTLAEGRAPGPFPPMFLSHGSPMTALEPREAGAFFQALGPALCALGGGEPRAVLAISAHSLTREPVLLAGERHHAVYDFGGFDPALRTMRYDAPGAPALAARAQALLAGAGLPAHDIDQGGLDHGIWTPLRWVFPRAQVAVLPLAWPPHWSPPQLWAMGAALAPLVQDGVWVMASGSITHNLGRVFTPRGLVPVDAPATAESTAFRDWFAARGAAADFEALRDWQRQAPHAQRMHPSDEHLLPFFVAAGAAEAAPALRLHASLTHGELGMDAYAFGPRAPQLQALLAAAMARPGQQAGHLASVPGQRLPTVPV